MRNWKMRDTMPAEVSVEFNDYDPRLQKLLFHRGIKTKDEAEKYLAPDYGRDLHDPFLISGMQKAVERVLRAIKDNERIIVYGDYDADGVPGVVIITDFFRKIGFTNFDIFIPDRHRENYGLSVDKMEHFAADEVKLIITVDCGITDVVEVEEANKRNIDVIITDHHLPPDQVPAAYVILNSKMPSDTYPFKLLCGAAVAFKLVQALIQSFANAGFISGPRKQSPDHEKNHIGFTIISPEIQAGWEKWLLDLIAISTVSDMVPMIGENRVLTYFGLKVLRKTKRFGLQNLYRAMKLKSLHINEDDIGFMIAPRLNSASRMSHANQAYYLLTSSDELEAQSLAQHLEEKNVERKKMVEEIVAEIENYLAGLDDLPKVVVYGNKNWGAGGLGLASGKIKDKYGRCVFLWGTGGEKDLKGSCRSDGRVNLVDLMKLADNEEQFFLNFGGHFMAAGFSIRDGQEDEFKKRLLEAYEKVEKKGIVEDVLIDEEITLDDINESLWQLVEKLGPYGMDNPKPVFLLKSVPIAGAKVFGNGGIHLELTFENSRKKKIAAIGFFSHGGADHKDNVDVANDHKFGDVVLEPGRSLDLLCNLEKSYFRGRPELRLRIVDLKPAGT